MKVSLDGPYQEEQVVDIPFTISGPAGHSVFSIGKILLHADGFSSLETLIAWSLETNMTSYLSQYFLLFVGQGYIQDRNLQTTTSSN